MKNMQLKSIKHPSWCSKIVTNMCRENFGFGMVTVVTILEKWFERGPKRKCEIWFECRMPDYQVQYRDFDHPYDCAMIDFISLIVPKPVLLRSHVLVMSFCGENGWPAPKLKDVEMSSSKARELYRDCVIMMWKIYSKCKLVHADLSEFNLLYHDGQIIVIDVSQSVEHDHPHAFEFLRKDCTNISEFFRKREVATMTVKELFDFITDPTINDSNLDEYLEKMSEQIADRDVNAITEQEKIDEEVFKKAYIPKRLDEVSVSFDNYFICNFNVS